MDGLRPEPFVESGSVPDMYRLASARSTGTNTSSAAAFASHLPDALIHSVLPILIDVFPVLACTSNFWRPRKVESSARARSSQPPAAIAFCPTVCGVLLTISHLASIGDTADVFSFYRIRPTNYLEAGPPETRRPRRPGIGHPRTSAEPAGPATPSGFGSPSWLALLTRWSKPSGRPAVRAHPLPSKRIQTARWWPAGSLRSYPKAFHRRSIAGCRNAFRP